MTPKTDAATPNILSAVTVEEAVRDLHAWVSVHWLQILIAAGAGLIVYSVLFMLRGLARRVKHVPGERPGVATLFGRAVGRTSQLFLVLASARLVASYANPPPPGPGTPHVSSSLCSPVRRSRCVKAARSRSHGGPSPGPVLNAYAIPATGRRGSTNGPF